MSTLLLRPLDEFTPPDPYMLFRVYSAWQWNCSGTTAQKLNQMARDGDVPHGMHGVGWYIHWMIVNYSQAREAVLVQPGRLFDKRALIVFTQTLDERVIRDYQIEISNTNTPRRLDARAVLVYDHLLRHGQSSSANQWLADHGTRMACEILGLPFVRQVLDPTTEASLWILATSRYAPCSPPQYGPQGSKTSKHSIQNSQQLQSSTERCGHQF